MLRILQIILQTLWIPPYYLCRLLLLLLPKDHKLRNMDNTPSGEINFVPGSGNLLLPNDKDRH